MSSIANAIVSQAHEFANAPYSLAKKEPKEKVTVTVEPTHQVVSDKPGFEVHGLGKNDPRREKTT